MPIQHVKHDSKRLLDEIETALNKAKRIVAITGAGISTNCGIPDFRSKDGLYSLINTKHAAQAGSKPASGHLKGQDLFSSTVWQNENSTAVFRTFIASLRRKINEDVKTTSQAHKFVRRLRDRKKLLRCYTQNIDGLEARDGLNMDISRGPGSRSRFTKKSMALPNGPAQGLPSGTIDGGCEVVQLHGDLETVRCDICQRTQNWSAAEQEAFQKGNTLRCNECVVKDVVRQAAGKRRSAVGSLRPNIVLYGENNPMETEIGTMLAHDLTFGADLLLIMGTSLKVHGLKKIVKEFAKAVHSKKTGKVVFINLSEPSKSVWKDAIDYWVEMDCDEWAKDKLKTKQTELDFKAQKVSKSQEVSKPQAPPKFQGISKAQKGSKVQEVSKTISENKENAPDTPPSPNRTRIPLTPGKKVFDIQSKYLTPPQTKPRILVDLDPISGQGKTTKKRSFLDTEIPDLDGLSSPPSSKRRKASQKFEIWDANETPLAGDTTETVITP